MCYFFFNLFPPAVRHAQCLRSDCFEMWVTCGVWGSRIITGPGLLSDTHVVNIGRLWRETLGLLLLWACLDSALARGCSSFFCRKSHRVSGLNGDDPGSPLFLTPYLEKGAIDEGKSAPTARNAATTLQSARRIVMVLYWSHCSVSEPPIRHLFFLSPARKLSLVGDLPGANVKSYAGYLTVNKKYNSNLFFWFFPALMVGSKLLLYSRGFPHYTTTFLSGQQFWERITRRIQTFWDESFFCTCAGILPVRPQSTCDKELLRVYLVSCGVGMVDFVFCV